VVVAVELPDVIVEINEDEDEDADDRDDAFEVVVAFADVEDPDFFDVEATRLVNGIVLTCAAFCN
jgi:hypothetical protein